MQSFIHLLTHEINLQFTFCIPATLFDSHSWVEIEEGRVGCSRLRSKHGALDLWVVYMNATAPAARCDSIHQMASSMKPADEVLSCFFGDFNFTEHARDRLCKLSGQETGFNDKANSKTWKACLTDRYDICEWTQSEHTHEMV